MKNLFPIRPTVPGLFLAVVLAVCGPVANAAKTDIIYLDNGNSITGEIKELKVGELKLSTDAMGDVYVKWVYVHRILSDKALQFELSDGSRYLGSIKEIDDDPRLNVVTDSGEVLLDRADIVHLEPIKLDESVWSAMDKRLQIGYRFTKATDIAQWNVAAALSYRQEEYVAELSLDSMITNDGDGDDNRRANLTGSYTRLLHDRWFWFGSGSLQRNDELGIKSRVLASGGGGRFVWQTQESELMLGGGLAVNRENSTSTSTIDGETGTDLEGLFQINWTRFQTVIPRSRITADLQYYPSFTESGRHRIDFDLRYRQEFFEDLFWTLTWYTSFDSKPPASAEAREDYGVITALEYKW